MAILVHPLVVPFNRPITIYQGATLRWHYAWDLSDSDGVLTPVDLSGCTGRARFWTSKNEDIPLFDDLTTANGGFLITGLAGIISIFVSDEQSELLPSITAGWWVAEVYWPDGDTTRLIEGTVAVRGRLANG